MRFYLTQINSILGAVTNEVQPENTAIVHGLVEMLKQHPDMVCLEYAYFCKFAGEVTQVIVSRSTHA